MLESRKYSLSQRTVNEWNTFPAHRGHSSSINMNIQEQNRQLSRRSPDPKSSLLLCIYTFCEDRINTFLIPSFLPSIHVDSRQANGVLVLSHLSYCLDDNLVKTHQIHFLSSPQVLSF